MKRFIPFLLVLILLPLSVYALETSPVGTAVNAAAPTSTQNCLPTATPEPAPTQTPCEEVYPAAASTLPVPATDIAALATPTPPPGSYHRRYVAQTYDRNGRPDFLALYRKPACEPDDLLFEYWMGTAVDVLDYVDANVAHVSVAGLEGYIHTDSLLTEQDILSLGFAQPKTARAYCPQQGLAGVPLYAEPSQMARAVADLDDGETVWVLGIGEDWLHLYMPRYQVTGFAKVEDIVENPVSVLVKQNGYIYQYPSAKDAYITAATGAGVTVLLLVDVPRYGWQKIRIPGTGTGNIAYIRTDDLDLAGTGFPVLPDQP